MEKRDIMYMICEKCNMEGDKMNKIIRSTLIILISILLIFNIPLYSNAITFDEIISNGDSFLAAGDENSTITPDQGGVQNLANTISNILLTIALGVTLISAVIMGINFAIESVEDKAKIKESMVPWIIGIIISFGAYGIWKITMNIFYGMV